MQLKTILLIGCFVWVAAGAGLMITGDASVEEARVAWFSYTERTPLTP